MKRLSALILALVLALGAVPALAAVDFDPSLYSPDELKEIMEMISDYLREAQAGRVLWDRDGILAEYRGPVRWGAGRWIVNLYIENNTAERIFVGFSGEAADGFQFHTGNNGAFVEPGVRYLAEPNLGFIIDAANLRPYGLTQLQTFTFTLDIKSGSGNETEVASVPVSLELNLPLD